MTTAISRNVALVASAAIALSSWCATSAQAQPADSAFKHFNNSIVPAESQQQSALVTTPLQESARTSTTLQLHFGLATRNVAELQSRAAKGEVVSPSELAAKYSGDPESAKKLVSWLRQQGFRSIETNADHTSVYAVATVAQIEKSLGVVMKRVTVNGQTTPAAITAPALPRDVGNAVIAIDGLQPWLRNNKQTNQTPIGASASCVPNPKTANKGAYKVYDILKAYNADGLIVPGKGRVTGKGQTIAILMFTPAVPSKSDIELFWLKNGVAVDSSRIQLIDIPGVGQVPAKKVRNFTLEASLDVEWASAIASGATINMYAASDWNSALDRIIADAQKPGGPRHLSISYAFREGDLTEDYMNDQNVKYAKLALLGVQTFVASGDAGANPDRSGHARDRNSQQVQYPAGSPSVIAVGGTVLQFDARSGKVAESGWPDSGGGVSKFHPRPEWQGANLLPGQGPPMRLVPDVSSNANGPDVRRIAPGVLTDGAYGAFIVVNGQECATGGTSWSAPVWAGFSALIAEAREKEGKPPLGFLPRYLYSLPPNVGFRDITAGNNGDVATQNKGYDAGPGWDAVTGLGVPDVRGLIKALPDQPPASSPSEVVAER